MRLSNLLSGLGIFVWHSDAKKLMYAPQLASHEKHARGNE